VVGTDPKTDLAVIKIEPKGQLPFVTFGDSDKVEVGEWVVAIGHPRGLDQTVTQGIISAKHRRGISDPNSYEDFLQTDAAINPGNSGGPLLNLRGEVIGVNAAIATESGGSEGIGFTIPSNIALQISKTLIQHGKVERGWLGVTIRDLTPDLAKSANLENVKGAYVEDVVKGGPAEKAGIRAKDVILSFGGKEVADSAALRNEVANAQIGKDVKVTILRQGKKEERTVRIESQEQSTKAMAATSRDRLGVEVRAIGPRETERFGISAEQGVVVSRLQAKGPLQSAGFEVGDIILAINDQPVGGVESFDLLVSTLKPHQRITLVALDHRTGNTGEVKAVVR
ncbi:MAG TPA: PDZ domain-containing protein, partial [Thermodesulfobacteriota bacterium]|nr:PDZ domain-containing protein [Thermodesulfobacteriota bacterium]